MLTTLEIKNILIVIAILLSFVFLDVTIKHIVRFYLKKIKEAN